MRRVVFLTEGDGSDGNEWSVIAVFSSEEKAEEYRATHNAQCPKWALITTPPEVWELDPVFDPKQYPYDPPRVEEFTPPLFPYPSPLGRK